jgi:broad specificity phosphatase PhoE
VKTLYLVRHGQSEANVDWHLLRTMDEGTVPLTKLGHEQAIEAGLKVKELLSGSDVIPLVFVSSWLRALQTYEEMAKSMQLTIFPIMRPDITEQHMNLVGHDENWAKFERFRDSGWGLTEFMEIEFDGGESLQDVLIRANKFVRFLEGFPEGRPIVVVSHGLFIKMVMAILDKVDPETLHHPRNCEIIQRELGVSLNSYEQLKTFCDVKGYKIVADAEDYGSMKVMNPKANKRVSVHIGLNSTKQILEKLGRLENE